MTNPAHQLRLQEQPAAYPAKTTPKIAFKSKKRRV
jgi:hypothetical protein